MCTQTGKRRKPVPKQLTTRNFNTYFLHQFYDVFNYGYSEDGEKQYKYPLGILQRSTRKSHFKIKEDTPKDICITDHLKENSGIYLHGHANVFSEVICVHGDIDPLPPYYGYEECVEAVLWFEMTYFPGKLYWEPSTTGRGIAFWFFLDFASFPPHLGKLNTYNRDRCNMILDNMSILFREAINSHCLCHFDGLRGYYSVYSFRPLTLLERTKMGRIPAPRTTEDFLRLYTLSQHPLTHSDLKEFSERLDEVLLPFAQFPHSPHQAEHTDSSPWQGNNAVCLPTDKAHTFSPPPSEKESCLEPSSLYPYNYWDRQILDDLGTPPDNPLTRCRKTVQRLARILGRMPSYEEWNVYYERIGWNTGAATKAREERFRSVVKYVERTFDVSKSGSKPDYIAGGYVEALKTVIPQKALDKANEGSKETVSYIDLDAGMGYVKYILCDIGQKNVGTNDELTVEQYGILNWVRERFERGECARKISKDRARRVFTLLREFGVIRMVEDFIAPDRDRDGRGNVTQRGRARRYILTPLHPDYYDFLEVYGVGIIDEYKPQDVPESSPVPRKPKEVSLEKETESDDPEVAEDVCNAINEWL